MTNTQRSTSYIDSLTTVSLSNPGLILFRPGFESVMKTCGSLVDEGLVDSESHPSLQLDSENITFIPDYAHLGKSTGTGNRCGFGV